MLEFEPYDQWKERNKPKRKAPEGQVKHACMHWLSVHRLLHNRQQAGRVQVLNPHTRKPYWVMLAEEGAGDIVGCTKTGRYYEVEVKSESGRQSPEQKAHQAKVEATGGLYILARSTDDLHILLTA